MLVQEIQINQIIEGYHPRKDLKGLEELKEQIKRDGLTNPIRVRPQDDHFVVVDGKRRLQVIKDLKWESVPCIIVEVDEKNAAHLSYVLNSEDCRKNLNPIEVSLHIREMRERFGYSVRDLVNLGYAKDDQTLYNKLSLLTLPQDIQDKIAEGDISPTIGYELARPKNKEIIPSIPEDFLKRKDLTVSKFKKKLRDLIDSGKRKREKERPVPVIPDGEILGVFFKDSSYMSELPDESVSLIVTSPPYNVGFEYEEGVSFEDHLKMIERVLGECVRVLVPGRKICVNVGDITTFGSRTEGKPEIQLIGHFYQDILQKLKVRLVDVIIWKKCHPGKRDFNWSTNPQVTYHRKVRHTTYRILNNTEYIFIFEKDGDAKLPFGPEISKEEWKEWVDGVWEIPSVKGENGHPAPFPEELVKRLIKMFSFEGEIVLDCFGGTMTTIKVARELNRIGIGYEKEKKYKPVIMKKLGVKEEDLKKTGDTEIPQPEPEVDKVRGNLNRLTQMVEQVVCSCDAQDGGISSIQIDLSSGDPVKDAKVDIIPKDNAPGPGTPEPTPIAIPSDDYEKRGAARPFLPTVAPRESGSAQLPLNKVILGDCLEKLKDLPDNSVDVIATDPPYGLKFMGKDWDKAVPSIDIWKECLRTMKPGALAFIMCSPRQDCLSRMIVNLEDAGFQMNFSPIYWTYAQGFPKAYNVANGIEGKLKLGSANWSDWKKLPGKKGQNNLGYCKMQTKQGYRKENYQGRERSITVDYSTHQAKQFEGSYAGFQPKPAVEVIIVAMKPMDEKTYVDQALNNGKGITWLDDCRIPYSSKEDLEDYIFNLNGNMRTKKVQGEKLGLFDGGWRVGKTKKEVPKGRFPANLLISDDVLNDGKMHTGGSFPAKRGKTAHFGLNEKTSKRIGPVGDNGSFSRFFSLDAWAEKNLPFLIVPKPSKKEKNAGLETCHENVVNDGRKKSIDNPFQRGKTLRKNNHPTVKPIKLMSYLITMGSREGDVVLDPFTGSGSTCVAAKKLNRKFIGIELNKEYQEIAETRVKNVALAKAA